MIPGPEPAGGPLGGPGRVSSLPVTVRVDTARPWTQAGRCHDRGGQASQAAAAAAGAGPGLAAPGAGGGRVNLTSIRVPVAVTVRLGPGPGARSRCLWQVNFAGRGVRAHGGGSQLEGASHVQAFKLKFKLLLS